MVSVAPLRCQFRILLCDLFRASGENETIESLLFKLSVLSCAVTTH